MDDDDDDDNCCSDIALVVVVVVLSVSANVNCMATFDTSLRCLACRTWTWSSTTSCHGLMVFLRLLLLRLLLCKTKGGNGTMTNVAAAAVADDDVGMAITGVEDLVRSVKQGATNALVLVGIESSSRSSTALVAWKMLYLV